MGHLVNQVSYLRKWRYELPCFLPSSTQGNVSNLCTSESYGRVLLRQIKKKHGITWYRSWKRVGKISYLLMKMYGYKFYNPTIIGDLKTSWWNVNYESSVKERFRSKKTKSGKIYKRVNSVLKV